jgi:uncharacterized protein YcfL
MKHRNFYEKFEGGYPWNRCIYKINGKYTECLYRFFWYKKDRVNIGWMIQTLSCRGVIFHTPEKFFNKVYFYGCDKEEEGFPTKKIFIKHKELVDLKYRKRIKIKENFHWTDHQINIWNTEFVRLEKMVGITSEDKKKIENNNNYSRNANIKRFLYAVQLNYYDKNFETKSAQEFEEWLEAWKKELTEGR